MVVRCTPHDIQVDWPFKGTSSPNFTDEAFSDDTLYDGTSVACEEIRKSVFGSDISLSDMFVKHDDLVTS